MRQDDPLDAGPEIEHDSEAEFRRLTAAKLRLEIEKLSTPWWRHPSNLGPVATIAASVLGLIWAIASGFFDVSRRELEIRKHELAQEAHDLAEKRDTQAAAFLREQDEHTHRVEQMQREVKTLTASIGELDQPFVLRATHSAEPTSISEHYPQVVVSLAGMNFGALQGKISGTLTPSCFDRNGTARINFRIPHNRFEDTLHAQIIDWSPEKIDVGVERTEIQKQLRAEIDRGPHENPPFVAQRCFMTASFVVTRSDGKTSNAVDVDLSSSSIALETTLPNSR